MLTADHRIVLLMYQGIRGIQGKTGLSVLRYSESEIVAVIDPETAGESLTALTGINRSAPIVASLADALPYHPTALVIGMAPSGGALPPECWQDVKQAVSAGLSIVNGLHTPLATHPELQGLLRSPQQWIWDIRQEPPGLSVATGQARFLECLRVLTVGTDMAVGKMSTSLQLHQAALSQGLRSKFLATGQTGLMLAQDGIPLDAVRVDFAAGAVEQMVLRFAPGYDLLQIEGQGSLFHPASTATLPLLRGSQPTHLILAHRSGQVHIRNFPHVLIPPLPDVIKAYETIAAAGGTCFPAKVVAIALNTGHLDPIQSQKAIDQVQEQTGLPCTDPIRFNAQPLLSAILRQTYA